MYFNDDISFKKYVNNEKVDPSIKDITWIAMHTIGHVLGLDDYEKHRSIMYPVYLLSIESDNLYRDQKLTSIASFEVFQEEEKSYEGDILILNEKNYKEIIKRYDYLLVDFYSSGCDWCRDLEPKYAKVATQLKEEGSVIKVAKVNDMKYPKVGAAFNISHYPTLLFFYNGIPIIYDDKLSQVAIVRWVKKRQKFLPKENKSVEKIKDLIISENVVIIGYFIKENTAGITKFYQLTTSFDDVPFGIIHDKNIAQSFNITEEGIVYFEGFTEDCNEFNETKIEVAGIMNVLERKCRQ
uniref:Thioredoxin domain-containing protein n=1 Tax=Panagrolaimus davidi TaxID=227884 RepID=A0A914QG47_9BILA